MTRLPPRDAGDSVHKEGRKGSLPVSQVAFCFCFSFPPLECFSTRLSRESGSMPACPKMQEIEDGILSVNSEAGGAQGRIPDRARLQAVNKGPLWQFASCFCQI